MNYISIELFSREASQKPLQQSKCRPENEAERQARATWEMKELENILWFRGRGRLWLKADFITALCFIVLPLIVCYFTNWRILATPETLPQSSLSAPFFQHHFCLYFTFGNTCNSSSFFIIIIFVLVTCSQQSLMLPLQKEDSLKAQRMVSIFFLAIKYF